MNIYYVEPDAQGCASAYCDKHLVFEIVQMAKALSTVHHLFNSKFKLRLYKAHRSIWHPVVHWVMRCDKNYRWTHELLRCLLSEFEYRFEHTHRTNKLLKMLTNPPRRVPAMCDITMRPQIIPHRYYVPGDPITGYRGYYHYVIRDYEKWTKREPPEWINEDYNEDVLPNIHHVRRHDNYLTIEPSGSTGYVTTTSASSSYYYVDNTV